MNWNEVGAIGQVLGSIAVFVTLGYLAVQLRRIRYAFTCSLPSACRSGPRTKRIQTGCRHTTSAGVTATHSSAIGRRHRKGAAIARHARIQQSASGRRREYLSQFCTDFACPEHAGVGLRIERAAPGLADLIRNFARRAELGCRFGDRCCDIGDPMTRIGCTMALASAVHNRACSESGSVRGNVTEPTCCLCDSRHGPCVRAPVGVWRSSR